MDNDILEIVIDHLETGHNIDKITQICKTFENILDPEGSTNKDDDKLFLFVLNYKNDTSHKYNLLGYIYYNCIGVEKNTNKAIALYKNAIILGNSFAMNNLAQIYESDIDHQDINKAIKLFNDSIKLGNCHAMNNLAHLYENNINYKNINKAIELYESAIKLNSSSAMNNLALLYEYAGDINKAIELYNDAIKLENSCAMNNLAHLYETNLNYKNISKAIELYNDAIKLGNSDAMHNCAKLYETEIDYQDFNKAIELYQFAIKLNYALSMRYLAQKYMKGEQVYSLDGIIIFDFAKDITKAILLFEHAIKFKNNDSRYYLAEIYSTEESVKDVKKAIQLYHTYLINSEEYYDLEINIIYYLMSNNITDIDCDDYLVDYINIYNRSSIDSHKNNKKRIKKLIDLILSKKPFDTLIKIYNENIELENNLQIIQEENDHLRYQPGPCYLLAKD